MLDGFEGKVHPKWVLSIIYGFVRQNSILDSPPLRVVQNSVSFCHIFCCSVVVDRVESSCLLLFTKFGKFEDDITFFS